MSEATFTQSSSPTSGLTNYDLEPGPKELYPAPTPGRQKRKRLAAWRKRYLSSGMTKGYPTMTENTIEAMVEMLSKSVAAIVKDSSDTGNRDALLSKSFAEFSDALSEQIEGALAKMAPAAEEPLFKGLGAVGRIANLVSTLANNVRDIQNGYDSWQLGPNNAIPANADPASPEVVEHLEDLLAHSEMILRCAVNEHCEPMDDGEDPGHHMVVMVPMGDGGEMAVKCDLPEDLAKFATDPAAIADMLADHSFSLLEKAGVDSDSLSKAIAGEGLAKDFGGGGAAPNDGSGADNSALPEGMGDEDPLTTLGRLAALMMIQIDYIQQEVNGTNEPTDPTGEDAGTDPTDAGGSPGTDPNAAPAATPPVTKAEGVDDLAKIAASMDDETLAKVLKSKGIDIDHLTKMADENARLRAENEEFDALAKTVLAQPAAPKAPLYVSGTIAKGAEDAIAPQQEEQDLSKLDPTSRAVELMKRQHKTSGTPVR